MEWCTAQVKDMSKTLLLTMPVIIISNFHHNSSDKRQQIWNMNLFHICSNWTEPKLLKMSERYLYRFIGLIEFCQNMIIAVILKIWILLDSTVPKELGRLSCCGTGLLAITDTLSWKGVYCLSLTQNNLTPITGLPFVWFFSYIT